MAIRSDVSKCSELNEIETRLAPDSPAGIFEFGKYLEREKEYYRAITEYQRFLFFEDSDELKFEVRFRIGRCYLAGEKPEEAEAAFNRLLLYLSTDPPSSDKGKRWSTMAFYSLGECFYKRERFAEAELAIENCGKLNDCQDFNHQICYSKIWCEIQKQDFPSAFDAIGFCISEDRRDDWRENLKERVDRLRNLPTRSPVVAGILSGIIPGSGQMYSNRFYDGLISLIINGVFIGAIIDSVNSDRNGLAWTLGFFEAGWYSANIYNAISDAHKFNRNEWENHLRLIESEFGSPFKFHEDYFSCP